MVDEPNAPELTSQVPVQPYYPPVSPPAGPPPPHATYVLAEQVGVAAMILGGGALAVHLFYGLLAVVLRPQLVTFRYVFDGLGHLEWALCGAALALGVVAWRSTFGKIGLVLAFVALAVATERFGLALLASLR